MSCLIIYSFIDEWMNFSSVPSLTKLFAELAIWYVSLFTYLLCVFVRDVVFSPLCVDV